MLIAGVLLVFSDLVVPTVCVLIFVEKTISRLTIGWIVGFIANFFGMLISKPASTPIIAPEFPSISCMLRDIP